MIIFQRAWLAWYYKSVINLGLDHLLSVRITQFRYSPRVHLALNILLFICLLFKDTLHNMDTCCSSTSKIFCSSSQTLSYDPTNIYSIAKSFPICIMTSTFFFVYTTPIHSAKPSFPPPPQYLSFLWLSWLFLSSELL